MSNNAVDRTATRPRVRNHLTTDTVHDDVLVIVYVTAAHRREAHEQ